MKGRVRKLVLLVLLGAIVNIAVAWGCAIRPNGAYFRLEYYQQYGSDGRLDLTTVLLSLPGEISLSQHEAKTSWARYSLAPEPIDEGDFRALVPTWSRFAVGEPFEEFLKHSDTDHELVSYDEYASGWPAYSLRYHGPIYVVCEGSAIVYDESRMTGYFHPTLPQKMVDGGYRSELPYLPIWPGFAINTAFYAAVLWLASLAPFTLRRVIRRKRGACIKCGYDLRHAEHEVCPECGAETTAKVVE